MMALRYDTDIEEKKHISKLALQLFDQTEGPARLGGFKRGVCCQTMQRS